MQVAKKAIARTTNCEYMYTHTQCATATRICILCVRMLANTGWTYAVNAAAGFPHHRKKSMESRQLSSHHTIENSPPVDVAAAVNSKSRKTRIDTMRYIANSRKKNLNNYQENYFTF